MHHPHRGARRGIRGVGSIFSEPYDAEKEKLILSGKYYLVNISVQRRQFKEGYGLGTVYGQFCPLDWASYKKDPTTYAMFRDLTVHSCNNRNSINYDMKRIVDLAKAKNDTDEFHVMEPSGFVYHESRCGSTLVANSLIAMDPEEHRVYSESQPLLQASHACGMRAGENCPHDSVVELLQDVIYLMGKTNDPKEKRMFFKIQSAGTKFVDVITEAFPETPWIFVYRDPVQVLMSQFSHGPHAAVCVHQFRNIAKQKTNPFQLSGREIRALNSVDQCAIHLSTLCQAALTALETSNGMGLGVNYENLLNKLIEDVIPNHFHVPMTTERQQRIIEIGGRYSKGGGYFKRQEDWVEDSDKKENGSTPEMKEASEKYLYNLFKSLEDLPTK